MEQIQTMQVVPAYEQAPCNYSDSEWLRPRQVVAQYNFGRTFLFSLIAEGVIRSVSLKKRGGVRGIRLISRASLDGYLASLVDQKEVRS